MVAKWSFAAVSWNWCHWKLGGVSMENGLYNFSGVRPKIYRILLFGVTQPEVLLSCVFWWKLPRTSWNRDSVNNTNNGRTFSQNYERKRFYKPATTIWLSFESARLTIETVLFCIRNPNGGGGFWTFCFDFGKVYDWLWKVRDVPKFEETFSAFQRRLRPRLGDCKTPLFWFYRAYAKCRRSYYRYTIAGDRTRNLRRRVTYITKEVHLRRKFCKIYLINGENLKKITQFRWNL